MTRDFGYGLFVGIASALLLVILFAFAYTIANPPHREDRLKWIEREVEKPFYKDRDRGFGSTGATK